MMTLYLRFDAEATATACLDGMAERGVTIDTIGQIARILTPGTVETLPGWHVNLRGESAEDREALAAFVCHPAQPFRVFA